MKTMLAAAIPALVFPAISIAANPVAPPPIVVHAPAPSKIEASAPEDKPKPKRREYSPGLIEVSPDGRTVYFAGTITNASYARLRDVLAANAGVNRLDIASSGGLVLPARLMASLVARRNLAVHVEHLCASACTLILLASGERTMGPDAQIGFHQSYQVDDLKRPRARQAKTEGEADDRGSRNSRAATSGPDDISGNSFGDMFSRKSLANAGVDAAFIERAMATRSNDMWYAPAAELLSAKVVKAQLSSPREGGPSWGVSRDAVAQSLPVPMWTALRGHDPALWDESVGSIWRDRNSGMSESGAVDLARSNVVDRILLLASKAPDILAARLATIQGEKARLAGAEGYTICRADPFDERSISAEERAETIREDMALVELMQLTRWEKPMSAKKADKLFARFLDGHLGLRASLLDGGDAETDCRNGLKLLEAIGSEPAESRGQVYRALMTLD